MVDVVADYMAALAGWEKGVSGGGCPRL